MKHRNAEPESAEFQVFSSLWDDSPEPAWIARPLDDGDYELLAMNPAQLTVLPKARVGSRYSELLGDKMYELTGGYRECLKTARRVIFDQRYPVDGVLRHFRSRLLPIRDEHGRVARIWGSTQDLTDIVEARDRAVSDNERLESLVAKRTADLERANAELERTNRELERTNEELVAANLRYHELALKDPLTGLSNRRSFEESGNREFSRSRRHGYGMALVLYDLDDLKRVNDEYGHPAGDEAIRRIATVLTSVSRATDMAARLGGDEFAIVLPETTLEEGVAIAKRAADALFASPVEAGGSVFRVGASAGVAALAESDESFQSLYERADQALYRAKNLGKKRVEREPPTA